MDKRNESQKQKISYMGRKDMKIEVLFGANTRRIIVHGPSSKIRKRIRCCGNFALMDGHGKTNVSDSGRKVLPLMITSMLIHTIDIEKLLNLEVLGITNFKENKTYTDLEGSV